MALTTTAEPLSDAAAFRTFSRSVLDGTAISTMSEHANASSDEAVMDRLSGNAAPGRKRVFALAESSAAASPSVRAHSVTS